MRLTYWYAERLDDHKSYSVIAKTKKDCVAQVAAHSFGRFEPPVKKVIVYDDAFDLFERATGEDGGRDCGYV